MEKPFPPMGEWTGPTGPGAGSAIFQEIVHFQIITNSPGNHSFPATNCDKLENLAPERGPILGSEMGSEIGSEMGAGLGGFGGPGAGGVLQGNWGKQGGFRGILGSERVQKLIPKSDPKFDNKSCKNGVRFRGRKWM